ncbi:MAG: hypothetical protein CR986_06100 [Ignavibacteriae bacterium]|nr:MAG: hypothetical protein CR986_06100 [Ignavibacteriota bacterium]
MNKIFFYNRIILAVIFLLSSLTELNAQTSNMSKIERWLSVGELANWYSSIGCEREEDGPVKSQQAGWRWPSPYPNQDMQAAKGLWIGAKNYYDPDVDRTFDFKVVHCGPRPQTGGINKEFFPVEFKHYAKFNPSPVTVDGQSSYLYKNTVEDVDVSMPYDQMLYNVVNTQIGITMKRKIFQFSNEYHSNYIVQDITFVNTGNLDGDSDIERTSGTLEDVYFYFQYRMAPCKETRQVIGNGSGWGINTLNDERGTYREDSDNPEKLRYQYAWHGFFAKKKVSYNNIGGPIFAPKGTISDADTVGRLAAQQFPGVLVLHADKNVNDRDNDPEQPRTTGVISSDGQYNYASNPFNMTEMQARYGMMTAGHSAKSHAERITDGNFATSTADPSEGSANSAGYSFVNGFGPYNIPYGDSIRIVLVEAAAGLSRDEAIRIGKLFKREQINAAQKNEYFLQGRDSLHQTFKRVVNNFENNWELLNKQPLPPANFTVNSRGGRIDLEWGIYNQGEIPKGFEIYRSSFEPVEGYTSSSYYSKFELIAELPADARSYSDTAIALNTAYYYYILSVGDEVPGNPELNIPAHKLKSSKFYTKTYAPAYKRSPGEKNITSKVRVVPNPYIVSANSEYLLYPNEPNKIVFVNISGNCTIKIFTEIGELVETIEHNDGSGSHDWSLRTSSNQFVVSGIYIAVLTDNITGDREIVKFTIIR